MKNWDTSIFCEAATTAIFTMRPSVEPFERDVIIGLVGLYVRFWECGEGTFRYSEGELSFVSTVDELAKEMRTSPSTARRRIDKTKANGKLVKIGQGMGRGERAFTLDILRLNERILNTRPKSEMIEYWPDGLALMTRNERPVFVEKRRFHQSSLSPSIN